MAPCSTCARTITSSGWVSVQPSSFDRRGWSWLRACAAVANRKETSEPGCATMVPTRYWSNMALPPQDIDDITLAIQFVIPEEFLQIAYNLGVFATWRERELFTEYCHLEDGTERVLLTVCGPAHHILHIQRDLESADLPDGAVLWSDGPFGPQPCAHA